MRREFRRIDPTQARIVLAEAGPRVLPTFPEALSEAARLHLQKLGVDVCTGCAISRIDADGVDIAGNWLAARTVLWAAGVAASPLGRTLGVPLDRAGRVPVQPDLSVAGHPEIFVAGDLATLVQDGKAVPGVAPAAKQMGAYVGRAIRARLRGQAAPAFRYRDFGNLATIGRMAAVVDLHGMKLSGVLAWWFWLGAHVFFLIGFRNRVAVLLEWFRSYWTYQRSARIIVGSADAEQASTPD